jgi:hypothetical protein
MQEKFGYDTEIASAVWDKAKVIEPDGKELLFNAEGGLTYVKGTHGVKLRRQAEGSKKQARPIPLRDSGSDGKTSSDSHRVRVARQSRARS